MNSNRTLKFKNFQVKSWINSQTSEEARFKSTQPEYCQLPGLPEELDNISFKPGDFVIPGWQGDGLLSKGALHVRRILKDLVEDAKEQFEASPLFSSAVKKMIFREFLSFCQQRNVECGQLQNPSDFWHQLKDPLPENKELLQNFSHSYAFRSVVIYTNKVRFILSLSEALNMKVKGKDLLNHNNFFNKVFVKGSSQELNCDSLKLNRYSWYRPRPSLERKLESLVRELPDLSTTEVNKVFTYDDDELTDEGKLLFDNKGLESLQLKDKSYSHALSHCSFGKLLNQLIIKFPQWAREENKIERPWTCYNQALEILNTKFLGDYLGSLTLSHWLAQESEVKKKQWNEIISPEFIESSASNGDYLKICHELQFLSFLVTIAKEQNHNPLELVTRTIRNKYSFSQSMKSQIPLFFEQDQQDELFYNRVVINFSKLPEKNPHHALLKKITSETNNLVKEGFLFILSNQKLFVPSQSEKVEQLLTTFKLEGHFNFEELRGRGEIPNYLYIFSKRQHGLAERTYLPSYTFNKKEPCLTFKFSGELSRFNKFDVLVEDLNKFFDQKSASFTPLYQSEIDNGQLCFEFHQDAILEGKLVSSAQKNSTSITHPNFFRNLTKSCVSLDQFFQVESLNSAEKNPRNNFAPNSGLLGLGLSAQEHYPLVLIVNFTNPNDIRLELVGRELYEVKKEEYGMAYYQYFGLRSKRVDIDVNTFREYFNSELGLQVIQLNLTDGPVKLKSKLRALLVPKFFEKCITMSNNERAKLKVLDMDKMQCLSSHPEELQEKIGSALDFIRTDLIDQYPWQILALLSNYKTNLINSLGAFNNGSEGSGLTQVSFTNPMIIEKLIKLDSKPVHTNNNDVYTDFLVSSPSELEVSLSDLIIKHDETEGDYLELHSPQGAVIRVYSDKELLGFIKFILSSALGRPVLDLIKQLYVPSLKDFKAVMNNFSCVHDGLEEGLKETKLLIEQILTRQITKQF
jgi:hypothetical protein